MDCFFQRHSVDIVNSESVPEDELAPESEENAFLSSALLFSRSRIRDS
jgi:hypothetical protein